MKNFVNQVQLVGHLGHDPEMMSFASGSHLVKLRIATNETYKDQKGNFNDVTQWHTVSAWGPVAERMASSLTKGQYVLITGKLENRSWEDSEGKKRYITQVKAREFALLQKKEKGETSKAKPLPF
jgi:single-strand DNA-binding protein